MIRKIKLLGVTCAAVCVLGSLSAAAAAGANFTASSYPASGSGSQTTKHVFTFQGQKFECTEATYTGTLAAASSQLKITPSYKGCTAFGFIGAAIDMNSCYFLFTVGTGTSGTMHIACSMAGDSITLTAGPCTIHVPAQTPTTPAVDYQNQHPGILITSTVSGIHGNVTSAPFCILSPNSTDTSGSLTGSTYFSVPGLTIAIM